MATGNRIIVDEYVIVGETTDAQALPRPIMDRRVVIREIDSYAHSRFKLPARLGLINKFGELVEKVFRIVRTGRGLGVVLHTEDRNGIAAQALHRAVIQVDMRNLCIRRQRLRVNREPIETFPVSRSLTG